MANTTTKAVTLHTIPAGTKPVICRGSTCGKKIYFVRNPRTGSVMPVDAECEGGKRPSETKDVGQLDMLSGGEAAVFDGKGCSHFLNCPDANQFTRGAR